MVDSGRKGLSSWREEELVMISMIEHFSFCPRQCALIYIENIFDENLYTIRGHLVHERVDEPGGEWIDGVLIERALPLWSVRHGLVGKADIVEFIDGHPYPVEHKSGRKKDRIHEDLQLCGQVFCLEEMFDCSIDKGAVFYFASKRRREVKITAELRSKTEYIIKEIREFMLCGKVPPAVHDSRCRLCSMIDSCLPQATSMEGRQYLKRCSDELYRFEDSEDI